jgi:hypothetical protein
MKCKLILLFGGLCLVGCLVTIAPEAWAQLAGGGGPMGSVVTKTNEARDIVVTVGKAAVGLVAAVLFAMALAGKVAWHWVIMVVVAGAGLTGLDAIVSWING